MATGRLGAEDLAAGVDTVLYTCPADTFAVVSCSIVNRGNSPLTIRIAVAATSTPTNAEYIEYETELQAKAILERTGIVMDAGANLVIRSSAVNCNAVAFGIETSTV